ncbi:MAG: hypothetical protein LBE59_06350 [Nevskiaceae bacterium]|nr:hypothetical protein [Nevskiaceae bacterium]
MKKSLLALAIAACFTTAAFADCTYPRAPGKAPDGNVATRDEMVAANKAVKDYNDAMNVYLKCIKDEVDAALAKDGASLTEDQKRQMAAMYAQKNDSAVDELTTVANALNEQIRVFKAKEAK